MLRLLKLLLALPDGLVRALFGGRWEVAGRTMDTQSQLLIGLQRLVGNPFEGREVRETRAR